MVMKRLYLLIVLAIVLPIVSLATTSNNYSHKFDSITVQTDKDGKNDVRRKMTHSVYPIQMHVVGKAIKVESPQNQILPIYTSNKTFYLIVKLSKGTNWISGLPKGKYFINDRLIVMK